MYTIDFENTQNDTKTEVWACGYCDISEKKPEIFTSMADMFASMAQHNKRKTVVAYTHNLSYDGSLISAWLFSEGYTYLTDNAYHNKTISGLIDGRGLWYVIKFTYKSCRFEIRDSLKILPSTLDRLARDFDTEHKKLTGTVDYYRKAGNPITDTERRYLENDIIVLAELLEKVQKYNLTDYLTIGSNCLHAYRRGRHDFDKLFPYFDDKLDNELRSAYMGGWCYLNPDYEDKILSNVNGYVYDVNSLYPFVMKAFSYPFGNPRIITDDIENHMTGLYIIKFKAAFELKENGFPFLKSETMGAEYMKESVFPIELTLCNVDFELFTENYYITDFEPIKLYKFRDAKRLFDDYINHWYNIKKNASSKSERAISKLFLNNLGGKFGTKRTGTIKNMEIRNNIIHFKSENSNKDGVYLPVAIFMTAYARRYIMEAARSSGRNFVYCDTDSIHSVNPVALNVGEELGQFKVEKTFDKARYVHKKTYVLHNKEGYEIKASGATQEVKNNIKELEAIEQIFTHGARFKGKLGRVMIEGGYILKHKDFTIQ